MAGIMLLQVTGRGGLEVRRRGLRAIVGFTGSQEPGAKATTTAIYSVGLAGTRRQHLPRLGSHPRPDPLGQPTLGNIMPTIQPCPGKTSTPGNILIDMQ